MNNELWSDLVKFLFAAFAIVCVFAIPVFLVFHDEYRKALLTCLFSIILLITFNADRIEAFKFLWLSAEMKKTIIEANATIELRWLHFFGQFSGADKLRSVV
ncbi:MAG: hypothetical protein V1721_00325 [Pseudomonadota bacterium]